MQVGKLLHESLISSSSFETVLRVFFPNVFLRHLRLAWIRRKMAPKNKMSDGATDWLCFWKTEVVTCTKSGEISTSLKIRDTTLDAPGSPKTIKKIGVHPRLFCKKRILIIQKKELLF